MYFLETLQAHAPCHGGGVCCIVFDIDGMLFEFLMNFLNIEKNEIYSCFLRVLCYFQHLKKNWVSKKISGWGGGGVDKIFIF